jgi:4-hydroxy-2-oxoheptanedioate aldolase
LTPGQGQERGRRLGGLKAHIKAGGQAFGCFLNSGSPAIAEMMAAAGYDCLMIDAEHSPMSIETMHAMATAIRSGGAYTLVRVPAMDPVHIKLALDLGVDGIMAPAISSAAEAKAFVAACRYPPEGHRGVAIPVIRASAYGFNTADYIREANDALLVIAQIEAVRGVAEAEAIAATPGIDLCFIGPHDLSASLGHMGQPDHPEAKAAIARVESSVRKAKRWLGTIPTASRAADRLFADGYELVLGSADLALLREAVRAQVERYKPPPRST